jgi:hypothetical protein
VNVAIMQPYIFPYIGYFQLVNCADYFVFYDDVNFVKKGWINRNRILSNGHDLLITVPLVKASQNRLINELELYNEENFKAKFISKIENSYKNAPYYADVIPLIREIINAEISNIGEYSANSILRVSNYLELNTKFHFSSILSPESKGIDRGDRLIYICKKLGGNKYFNAIGGKEIYTKEYFKNNEIDIFFVQTLGVEYSQFSRPFVPNLSIIDVLMFNPVSDIRKMLKNHVLI